MTVSATRAMGMTMSQFLLRGGADLGDLDIKAEILARERMIAVDGDMRITDVSHDNDLHLPLTRIGVELVANLNVVFWNLGAGHLHHKFLIVLAVGISGLHMHGSFVALLETMESAFKTGDDLTDTFQIAQRLISKGGLQHVTIRILEGVVKADNIILGHTFVSLLMIDDICSAHMISDEF